MKLHLNQNTGINVVTAYDDGVISINHKDYSQSLLLLPDQVVTPWAKAGYDGLTVEDFAQLLNYRPEIILIGTGAKQRFPDPLLLRPLINAKIGFEIMNIAAACRTYNILVVENRRVAAALLFN